MKICVSDWWSADFLATPLRPITAPLTGSHSDLLRHLINSSRHDEIKATPKWLIELELIGLKAKTLGLYFILSGGNHCFPVVLMSSNIYLCPALIVLLFFLFIPLFSHGNVGASEVHCQVKTLLHTVATQEAPTIPCVIVFTVTMLPPRPVAWDVRKAAATRLDENKIVLHQWERTDDVRRFEVGSKIRVFCFERILYFKVRGKSTVSHFLSVWVCPQWLVTHWLCPSSGFAYF